MEVGEKVVIIGGGPIGLGAAQAAIAFGASDVMLVEPVAQRRAKAEKFDVRTISTDDARLRKDYLGYFDISIDCVTVGKTVQLGLDLVRPGGREVVVGVSTHEHKVDTTNLMLKEKALIGTAGRLHRADFAALAAMVARGTVDLKSMVTSQIAVDDIVQKGFDAMRNDRENQIKILIRPEKGLE